MIFYDSSEARDRSRVADALAASNAKSVVGLERETGADFLISAASGLLPAHLKPGVLPHRLALEKHLACGLLVQRKSGQDLVSSVSILTSNILPRMREAKPRWGCWLLATGWYGRNAKGNVVVTRNQIETRTSWNALNGALMAWQLDGGYYDLVGDDELVLPWLENADWRLGEWQATDGRPIKVIPRVPVRDVQLSDKDNCALAVLTALPGIREKRARVCLEWESWGGDLSTILMWLSNPDIYDADLYPPGIGRKTVERIHECLGGGLMRDPMFPIFTMTEEV
jgi:hypothetical protein